MEHVGQVVHVNAARGHIRSDQHLEFFALKAQHHAVALVLGEVAMDGIRAVTLLDQSLCEVLGVALLVRQNTTP